METRNHISAIIEKVLDEIKPRDEDYELVTNTYRSIERILDTGLRDFVNPNNYEISLQGSVAKDTFLRGETDLDVFVLFNPSKISLNWIKESFVDVVGSILDNNGIPWTTRYATHPYIVAYVNNLEVNIVPAYKVSKASEIITAVDRTPFHTEYILKKLRRDQRDEVRILKYFLKKNHLYGAEIKVQGFSGYLTELLVVAYGTFIDVLENACQWKPYRVCIDIERHYGDSSQCLKIFKDFPLIVVDPVDRNRNAAAAVSMKRLAEFILLAIQFLEKPSLKYFVDRYERVKRYSIDSFEVRKRLELTDSCIYGYIFKLRSTIPDIVWGQLRRVEKILLNTLKSHRFEVVYVDSWSNDKDTAITVAEIMNCSRPCYDIFLGPPIHALHHVKKFIQKNRSSVVGPWVDSSGRLYTIKLRRYCRPRDLRDVITNEVQSFLKALDIVGVIDDIDTLLNICSIYGCSEWLQEFLYRKSLIIEEESLSYQDQ